MNAEELAELKAKRREAPDEGVLPRFAKPTDRALVGGVGKRFKVFAEGPTGRTTRYVMARDAEEARAFFAERLDMPEKYRDGIVCRRMPD